MSSCGEGGLGWLPVLAHFGSLEYVSAKPILVAIDRLVILNIVQSQKAIQLNKGQNGQAIHA